MASEAKRRANVAPRRGAWIEISSSVGRRGVAVVAPRRGAWIEIVENGEIAAVVIVAPRRGAWIEMTIASVNSGKE